jgi:subtilisin family serine protease
MKKIIVFWFMCISVTISYAQDYFMYIDGKKHYFVISHNKVLVQFEKKAEMNTIRSTIQKNTSFQLSDLSETDYKGLKIVSFSNTDKTKITELVTQWKNKDEILYSAPVFVDENGRETAAVTNQINIRLKQEKDYPVLKKAIASYNIINIEKDEFDNYIYLLSIDYLSEKNAIQIANELYETGLFEYVEPNLLLFIKYETDDTYFPQQWGLNNTGQYGGTSGIDIKANQAWNITTGSPNIKIAILDSGVDLTHPDLANNLLSGYDATGGGNSGNQSGVAHGTACAGIVASQGNNSLGTVGVAYNCNLLPIHMGSSPLASRVATGLNWAKQNGAKVISMSFSTEETNAVNTAISQAVSSNCVLVAASGNENASTVSYPANSSNVIAVGAISQCGQRKSQSSCDGESWGSNYGSALDVVAPGVKIYTTDIQGNAGYNTASGTAGNYYASFNGTSAACPHVAGVAALILSAYPNLTQTQVRQAIESTCTKLSGYSFATNSSHPNGTWNNQVGHGLVNAYAALNSVVLNSEITGADFICTGSNTTYTIANKPSNATVTWTYSGISLNGANNTTSSSAVFHYSSYPSSYLYNGSPSYSSTGPTGYYNAWIQAKLNFSDGTSFTLPVKYIAEKGLIKGTYQQGSTEKKFFTVSNMYVTSGSRTVSIDLFSDPSITYSWSIVNITKNSTSYAPDLYVYANGRQVQFPHSYNNAYRLTVSSVYCGASHSETFLFEPVAGNGSGGGSGGGCMFSYRSGDGAMEVSFEDTELQQAYSTVTTSKTKSSYSVKLYNITGSLIKEGRSLGETVIWNLSAFPDGVYVLSVKDSNDKEVYNKSFLKN